MRCVGWTKWGAPVSAVAVVFALGVAARGQVESVRLSVAPEHIGLGGWARPGTWTPLLVSLTNQSARIRQVRVQWVCPDIDGDPVLFERTIRALNPNRTEQYWLYAALPATAKKGDTFFIRLLDDESESLLATESIVLEDLGSSRDRTVGIVGSHQLGLEPYADNHTRHEQTRFLRGLTPHLIPDRWYGLSSLEVLVWTPPGGDPGSLPRGSVPALRQWVRRGGHLVIVLPAVLETWSDSDLADLLPPVQMLTLPDQSPPVWLGRPLPTKPVQIPIRILTPMDPTGGQVKVLLRDKEGRAVVVAHQSGLGRVTVIGVDLTDARLVRAGLPNGVWQWRDDRLIADSLWPAVFGWSGPPLLESEIDRRIEGGTLVRPFVRSARDLDAFLGGQIAMTKTAAAALFAAIVLFGLYWLVAGPVSYAVLRSRDRLRASWLVFTATVAVFAVVAWGGASLLRPRAANVQHFSIVEIEAPTGLVRIHSWMSLFVPWHGRVRIELPEPGQNGNISTIASAGIHADAEDAGFLDPQSYVVDAANPSAVTLPVRATAKQLELDHLGEGADLGSDPASDQWVLPQGPIKMDRGWPEFRLSHGLPGDLRDLVILYCPGEGPHWERQIWVQRRGAWKPGSILALTASDWVDGDAVPLLLEPLSGQDKWRGFLGDLMTKGPGTPANPPQAIPVHSDQRVYAIEMLTFYGVLPPPKFQDVDFLSPPVQFNRSAGRILDLTRLLPLKRLIILGHLERSPLPAPLRVEGQTVPSAGWTVVRWVHEL